MIMFMLILWLFMGKMRKTVFLTPIATILTTESQIWYVCVGFHLLSSLLSFYLIFHKYDCHSNKCYYLGIAQCPNVILNQKPLLNMSIYILLLIIVVVTTR